LKHATKATEFIRRANSVESRTISVLLMDSNGCGWEFLALKFFSLCMHATTCEDQLTITLVSGEEEIVNRAYFFLPLT
jgi:hypothetical protein